MKDIDNFLASHDCRESKRAVAVKMALKGYRHELIAELLQISLPFIRKWKRRYEQDGASCFFLHYKGRQPLLSSDERRAVISFLRTKEYYSIENLRDYVEEHYDVVFKSKQSYYDLLHEAHISWKKNTARNPKHDPKKVEARREEIKRLLASRREEIESGALVVFIEDECHLLWGDTIGYIWGRMDQRIVVPIKNIRERQTYYGALNFATQEFHACPFDNGDSVCTVKFVKHLQGLYPQAKLLFLWDGASYHTKKDMKTYLKAVNAGLSKKDWKITCELFAPNAPEQNPVEDIWLQGKNFLRRCFYKFKTFAQVKKAFLHFLQTTQFDFPKLSWYSYI